MAPPRTRDEDPAPPRTVDEVYKRQSRYARLRHLPHTEADVARAVMELDETLGTGVLSFEEGPERYRTYVAAASGVWERQEGRSQLKHIVGNVRTRINELLLKPLRDVATWLKSKEEEVKAKAAAEEVAQVDWIYTRLGSSAFVRAVVAHIEEHKAVSTRSAGITQATFDARADALGFEDGVYDFELKRLVVGWQAQQYYVSRTVGYAHEEMMEVGEEDLAAFDGFLAQVQAKEENRRYLLASLRYAARKRSRQVFLVHYNRAGSNGKTTFFGLVKRAFGALFVTCDPELLVASAAGNANSANEELMSVLGTCVCAFSEPSKRKKLSNAFVKRLVGLDDQSTRGLYGHKRTFVFMGLANLLCNSIPHFDDTDGGLARRLRCLPYSSRFVAPGSPLLGTSPLVFPMRPEAELARDFEVWRMCLMRRILEAPDEVEEPADVLEHTNALIERESIVERFVREHVEATGDDDMVMKLRDAWAVHRKWCFRHNQDKPSYSAFQEDMEQVLGAITAKSGGLRSFWRGYRVLPLPPEVDTEEAGLDALEG